MSTMAVVAAEQGYGMTTVEKLLERADVSRRTFYVHFESREDCFFATYDAVVGDVLGVLDFPAPRPRKLLAGVLGYFSEWPAHARVLLTEIFATGPAGAARHEQTMGELAGALAGCPAWQPGRSRNLGRDELAQAVLGGMLRVAQRRLALGGELDGLLPALSALATRVGVTPVARV